MPSADASAAASAAATPASAAAAAPAFQPASSLSAAPAQPASVATTSAPRVIAPNPFAGWSVDKVSSFFLSLGSAYEAYGAVVRANGLTGEELGDYLAEGETGVNNLLGALQITNSLHVRVLRRAIMNAASAKSDT